MSKTVRFLVKNDLPAATTNHVLVFLKPVDAKSDYQYYAWQDLNPSMGSTSPFDFAIDISVDAIDPNTGSISARVPINPGQCFTAVNPNGQSPYINGIDIGGVTPSQAGVKNGCNTPDTNIALDWYNKGNKVVTVGLVPPDIINVGKTVTFELQPSLYFMAADPTIIGPNFTLQDYSATTEYRLDVSTDIVHVRWYRDTPAGQDKFSFDPPSHSSITSFLAQPENKEGKYTNVRVVAILTGEILLSGGTGTMSSYGAFACGDFQAGSYPTIDQRYKITALDPDGEYFEKIMKCITSDHKTCEFKEG